MFCNNFIYLLVELGFCCCVRAFSSRREQGPFFPVVLGLLIAAVSLVVEHGHAVFISCGARACKWRMGLVASWHVGSSWIWVQTGVPYTGRWILIHGTVREVL